MLSKLVRHCWQPSRALQYAALIIVVLYIVLGALIFMSLESEYQLAKVKRDKTRFHRCVGDTLRFTLPSMTRRYDLTARQLVNKCFKPPSAISLWSFTNAALFAFCVVTTIGYGHLVPETANGMLFCSFYSMVGVPLTMIAIANIGKYISDFILWIERKLREILCKCRVEQEQMTEVEKAEKEEEGQKECIQGDRLVIAFALYLAFGSALISWLEHDMTYFVAFYFNLQSLTTVGFGDLWPKNEHFMWLTMLYLATGLAIASIALSVASEYLRKLHYYRQRLENARQVVIRIGGSNLTVGRLLVIVAKQLGVEPEALANLNLEEIVEYETNKLKLENPKKEVMLPALQQANLGDCELEGPPPTTPEENCNTEKVRETVTSNECNCVATVARGPPVHKAQLAFNDLTGYKSSSDDERSLSDMSEYSQSSSVSHIAVGRLNKIPIRKKEKTNKQKIWSSGGL